MNETAFLVIFNEDQDYTWELGKIFLKKYILYFNLESKEVRYYHVPPSIKKSFSFIIIIIIVAVVVAIALILFIGIYLGKKLAKQRKLRAKELEDNYEYLGDQ